MVLYTHQVSKTLTTSAKGFSKNKDFRMLTGLLVLSAAAISSFATTKVISVVGDISGNNLTHCILDNED